ncbi:ribonuclease H-like domain-containing protein [Tanacetum coccineum]
MTLILATFYTFLDTQPYPLLTSLASKLPNSSTNIPHHTSSPTAPPITDPNQSPTHTGPNSPGPTFPTNQPTCYEPHNTQTQNSLLPPPIFDPPNPQTNTDLVNEPPRTHPMITRSQSGIVKPIDHLSLNTFLISPIPKNPSDALKDPQWRNAIYDEYNHKFHADGTLSRYKARLVANGSSQQLGVDFDETFSPVVKPATIRTVLSLVVSRKCPIHQLDVKNVFLNGDLSETAYMYQPPGFVDARFPNHRKYALQLLERAHMVNCNPSRTPLDTESKLGPDGVLVQDPTMYRSLAGGLQYLTFTRPNLSYAVQQICLYMHDPREPHLAALKRILRYVRGVKRYYRDSSAITVSNQQYATDISNKFGDLLQFQVWYNGFTSPCDHNNSRQNTRLGTLDLGLHLYASSTTSLVGYTDADWAGCPSTRSAEAEYRGVANVVAETAWLRNLLRELHSPLSTATLVYCDNVSAVYMSANPVQHQRTKHIEIDIHFVRDMVTAGQVRVLHVPSRFQYADIFTKGLPSALFEEFRSSLSVRPPPAPTAGAY